MAKRSEWWARKRSDRLPNPGRQGFLSGQHFIQHFPFANGEIRLTAMVDIDRERRSLRLWDVDIRPLAGDRLDIGAAGVFAIFGAICKQAADGLDSLIVSGYRISGANPDREADLVFACRPSLREALPAAYSTGGREENRRMTSTEQLQLRLAGHDASVAIARQMLAAGATLEDVWRRLRADGLDMIDSKYVTIAVTDLSADDAQDALYRSDTWTDLRPAIDRLDAAMLEVARQLGAEVGVSGELAESTRRR